MVLTFSRSRYHTRMISACSHLVIATENVPQSAKFFAEAFSIAAHYENDAFAEFILPSRFRIAFFKPMGESARSFASDDDRGATGIGITVTDVNAMYAHLETMIPQYQIRLSGPPKNHSWGEKSFLLFDPDGNRWEVTQSPSADGLLVEKDQSKTVKIRGSKS